MRDDYKQFWAELNRMGGRGIKNTMVSCIGLEDGKITTNPQEIVKRSQSFQTFNVFLNPIVGLIDFYFGLENGTERSSGEISTPHGKFPGLFFHPRLDFHIPGTAGTIKTHEQLKAS